LGYTGFVSSGSRFELGKSFNLPLRLYLKSRHTMQIPQNEIVEKRTSGTNALARATRILGTLLVALTTLATITGVRAQDKQVTIPAGTTLLVKLDKAVSSSDKPGTKFSGVLQGDLAGTGGVAVKAGTPVYGDVTESKKAKRLRGKAQVTYALSQVNINGQLVPIVTQPIEDVAASSTRKTAKGAAAGAAIGAVADGGDGAAKGAAIGAGVSAVKKGESAGSAAGDLVEFKLAAPLTVTIKP
jgi:hypothetical protein